MVTPSRRFLRWLACRLVAGLVVNSSRAAEGIQTLGLLASDRVHHIRNGVERGSEKTRELSWESLADLGIRPEHQLVATVGNLHPQKNHTMFVEAMILVLRQHPEVRCLLVGCDVPSHPLARLRLKEQIRSAGLEERVLLSGPRDDVASLMGELSVFCLTSKAEGTPNVVLEAMAQGVPVVATQVGDVGEILEHGKSGFVVSVDDAESFAKYVIRLLDQPELRRRTGDLARQQVMSRYGCEEMARAMEGVYMTWLQRGRVS